MSSSKEISINRPHSHYTHPDTSRIQRFLSGDNSPVKRREVMDAITQIAWMEYPTWGKDSTHAELSRNLGISRTSAVGLSQNNHGRIESLKHPAVQELITSKL